MQILMAVLMATFMTVIFPRASVCAERIGEVLSTQASIVSPGKPVRPPAISGAIRMDTATFRYPGADRPVLEEVSFAVPPGTTTAVVGSTGSGKSTLLSLICRLYDVTAGAVRVDGIDVRELDTEQLWSAIGLVPQRGYLFSGTVAENLAFGRPEATEAEIRAAADAVGATPVIEAMPDGFDTRITERGAALSAGQRQLISLARMLVTDARLVILDEATSSLDPQTEADVIANVRAAMQGRTLIVITHREELAARFGRRLVVKDGGAAYLPGFEPG